jgi:hypothetical protein
MADLLREKIIEAIRAGDENIFEMFFKLEYNKVVFFVNQFLKDTIPEQSSNSPH